MSLSSCKKLDYLNANLKDLTVVSGEAIYNGATRTLLNQLFTFNVNNNNTELFVQHFAETQYTGESRYDMVTRTIPGNHMNSLYRAVLMNYKDAKRLLTVAPLGGIDQKQRDNQLAIIEVMSVFAWSNLVETFGNIPYSDALDYTKPNPKYDDGLTIYKDLITRLDVAIATLTANSAYAGMSAGYDNVYGGTATGTPKWVRFANTLKLKMGLMLSDISTEAATTAKTAIESAAPNVFNLPITSATAGDKFALTYLSAAPNQNPVYTELVVSGRSDYVTTSIFVNPMNTLSDPRRPGFMWTQIAGAYSGGNQGASNDYPSFTHVDNNQLLPTREVVLLDYTEAEFLLAEAAARGYVITGSVEAHYNNAITSSILYWGGTVASAATYLTQPAVAYTTATGTWRQKIGTQAWYAYYLRGFEAWTSWRRLDYPRLIAPATHVIAVNGVPMRYIYPVSEQTLNEVSYDDAVTAIGGDLASTRLFWDKGPENYDSSFN